MYVGSHFQGRDFFERNPGFAFQPPNEPEDMRRVRLMVTDVLDRKGALAALQADVKKNVYLALVGDGVAGGSAGRFTANERVTMLHENPASQLLAHLVREYLEFYHLQSTTSVFVSEARLAPKDRKSRERLVADVDGLDGMRPEPLLLEILMMFMRSMKLRPETYVVRKEREDPLDLMQARLDLSAVEELNRSTQLNARISSENQGGETRRVRAPNISRIETPRSPKRKENISSPFRSPLRNTAGNNFDEGAIEDSRAVRSERPKLPAREERILQSMRSFSSLPHVEVREPQVFLPHYPKSHSPNNEASSRSRVTGTYHLQSSANAKMPGQRIETHAVSASRIKRVVKSQAALRDPTAVDNSKTVSKSVSSAETLFQKRSKGLTSSSRAKISRDAKNFSSKSDHVGAVRNSTAPWAKAATQERRKVATILTSSQAQRAKSTVGRESVGYRKGRVESGHHGITVQKRALQRKLVSTSRFHESSNQQSESGNPARARKISIKATNSKMEKIRPVQVTVSRSRNSSFMISDEPEVNKKAEADQRNYVELDSHGYVDLHSCDVAQNEIGDAQIDPPLTAFQRRSPGQEISKIRRMSSDINRNFTSTDNSLVTREGDSAPSPISELDGADKKSRSPAQSYCEMPHERPPSSERLEVNGVNGEELDNRLDLIEAPLVTFDPILHDSHALLVSAKGVGGDMSTDGDAATSKSEQPSTSKRIERVELSHPLSATALLQNVEDAPSLVESSYRDGGDTCPLHSASIREMAGKEEESNQAVQENPYALKSGSEKDELEKIQISCFDASSTRNSVNVGDSASIRSKYSTEKPSLADRTSRTTTEPAGVIHLNVNYGGPRPMYGGYEQHSIDMANSIPPILSTTSILPEIDDFGDSDEEKNFDEFTSPTKGGAGHNAEDVPNRELALSRGAGTIDGEGQRGVIPFLKGNMPLPRGRETMALASRKSDSEISRTPGSHEIVSEIESDSDIAEEINSEAELIDEEIAFGDVLSEEASTTFVANERSVTFESSVNFESTVRMEASDSSILTSRTSLGGEKSLDIQISGMSLSDRSSFEYESEVDLFEDL